MKIEIKRPANREVFERRVKEFVRRQTELKYWPAPMTAMECTSILQAYYGSTPKLLWHIGKTQFTLWRHSKRVGLAMWISDKVGWTKMHHQPETPTTHEYYHRHGSRCSGSPNCSQHCIAESIPKWFQKIGGIIE